MRERVGEADVDNTLSLQVFSALQESGCHVFTRQSQQRFTKLAGAGGHSDGEQLHCTRSVLGRRVVQPLAEQSHLLSSFNRPINIQYMYVLREDADKATSLLKRLALER